MPVAPYLSTIMRNVRPFPTITTIDKLLFLERVSKEPTATGCLLWTSNKNGDGYGWFRIGKEIWGSHRIAYWIKHGFHEPGKLIRHKCDTPLCCNPDHLIPGTHAQNMADRTERCRPQLRRMGEFISTSEAGRMLGISSASVSKYCHAGILRGRRVHNRGWWQVEKSSVLEKGVT